MRQYIETHYQIYVIRHIPKMITWTRVRYRVGQFFHTFWTSFQPVDAACAARHLSADMLALFRRMPRAEQHHGIDVCRKLEAQGYTDPDLLSAALLHDVGKTLAPPQLWERVIVVLGEYFFPTRARRWSTGEARGLRRGFVIRRLHPQWGAALTEQAGASPRTVALIRYHHDPPCDDAELAILQKVENT